MNAIHRFPHGATRGPGMTRPLSGYGRPVGRPGPRGAQRRLRPSSFEPEQLINTATNPVAVIVAVLVELRERSVSS